MGGSVSSALKGGEVGVSVAIAAIVGDGVGGRASTAGQNAAFAGW